VAATVLLAACQSAGPASCAPCAGPGFVARGLPSTVDHGVLQVCVGDAPCTRRRLDGPIPLQTQNLVDLPEDGRTWEQYDGTAVAITVGTPGDRWQGSGEFVFTDGGDGECSCPHLVAQVVFSRVG
jgi:hypothetical protein